MMRAKYTRALREGRLLRNAKGHIVVPEVVKNGVILTPDAAEVPLQQGGHVRIIRTSGVTVGFPQWSDA